MRQVDFVTLLYISAVLTRTSSVDIVNMFDASIADSMSYGLVLQTFTVRSKLECMTTCSALDICRSVTFEPVTMTCSINRWVVYVTDIRCVGGTACSAYIPVTYAVKNLATTVFLECQSNFDCVDPQSECRNNQCLCNPGYSYDGNQYACVSVCNTYGTTFQPDNGMVLLYNNQATVKSVTLETCKSRCISETGFVCKTIEYDYTRSNCYLQDYTAFDRPDIYSPFSGYNLYTRDCAY